MLDRLISRFTLGRPSGTTQFLVFLFPVLVSTMKDAGSVIYAISVLTGLTYCRGAWPSLSQGEKRWLTGLVVFFFFSACSLLITEDLREGLKRIERYIRLLGLIPIYLMLRKKRITTAPYYLAGALCAALVSFVYAIYEVEYLQRPIASGAYHKIIFGNQAILVSAFIICGSFFYAKKRLHYIAAVIAAMPGIYASLLSGTRTAWLFVPYLLVCLVLLYRKKINKTAWAALIACAMILILTMSAVKPPRLLKGFEMALNDLEQFQEDPSQHSSLGARLVMWRNSVLIFKESPFFGTGLGDFKNDSLALLEKGLSYKNNFAVNQSNAHNLYFQLLAEGGLVGLSIMMTTLFIIPFIILYKLWRIPGDNMRHCFALCGLIGVLAFFWFGVSESWVNRNPMITNYCMTLLVFISSAANQTRE